MSFSGTIASAGQFCSICEIATAIRFLSTSDEDGHLSLHTNNNSTHPISTLDYRFHQVSSEFIRGQQQDASLFLTKLFEHFTRCSVLEVHRLASHSYPSTVIDQAFRIRIQSAIKCLSCSTQNETIEPYYMLSLPVNNADALDIALGNFFQQEILTGDNAYYCNVCNDLVTAEKQLAVQKAPPILVVHFKRGIGDGIITRKLAHVIKYQEKLDMSPYFVVESIISSRNKRNGRAHGNEYSYHLYAVIVHTGVQLDSGHYVAYVRTRGDRWINIDDDFCHQVSLNEVLNNRSAYVLFYAHAADLTMSNSADVVQTRPQYQKSLLQPSLWLFEILDCLFRTIRRP